MTTHELIEKLTWALVEVTTQKPDVATLASVLESSLGLAIKTTTKEELLRHALVRTAAMTGEPMAAFQ